MRIPIHPALDHILWSSPCITSPWTRTSWRGPIRRSGQIDKAIAEYQKLLTFDPASQDRRIRNPVYHFRLAKLYEQKGLKAEAKKEYARFLELWKDADPGLTELADAQKRFAEL